MTTSNETVLAYIENQYEFNKDYNFFRWNDEAECNLTTIDAELDSLTNH